MRDMINLTPPYNYQTDDYIEYSVFNWFWFKSKQENPPTNILKLNFTTKTRKNIDKFITDDDFTLIQKDEKYSSKNKPYRIDFLYTNIAQDIVIHISSHFLSVKSFSVTFFYLKNNITYVESVKDKLIIKERKKKEVNVKLLAQDCGDYYLTDNTNIKKTDLDLKLFYDDELFETNKLIVSELDKKRSGLYILNGEPGSGKTNYIRHLISQVKKKNIVIIPSYLIGELASPALTRFLISDLSDTIIILEDAEELIMTKNDHRNNGLSNILNISDGILGDMLNIQFIITFNTSRDNVDKALLRSGRLIAEHAFGKLDKDKATAISKNIGKNIVYTEDVILTDIFNEKTTNVVKENKKISFI